MNRQKNLYWIDSYNPYNGTRFSCYVLAGSRAGAVNIFNNVESHKDLRIKMCTLTVSNVYY